jgi:hypothetical protein
LLKARHARLSKQLAVSVRRCCFASPSDTAAHPAPASMSIDLRTARSMHQSGRGARRLVVVQTASLDRDHHSVLAACFAGQPALSVVAARIQADDCFGWQSGTFAAASFETAGLSQNRQRVWWRSGLSSDRQYGNGG